jgi:hypothetical protein
METTKPRGAPLNNLNALKHGHYARRQALKQGHIDKRSSAYKLIARRIAELKKAAGGKSISPQKLALITDIARTEVLLLAPREFLQELAKTNPFIEKEESKLLNPFDGPKKQDKPEKTQE